MSASGYDVPLLKIPVSDIEVSGAFYADKLGFEPPFTAPEYGWAQLSVNGQAVALYRPGMGGGNGNIIKISMR